MGASGLIFLMLCIACCSPLTIQWLVLSWNSVSELQDRASCMILSALVIQEEFGYTKKVIIICISKKNKQHNGQKKKDKGKNNDQQNTIHKTEDRVTRIPLKTGSEHRCSGRIRSSFSTSGTRRVNLVTLTAQIEPVHDKIILCSYQ